MIKKLWRVKKKIYKKQGQCFKVPCIRTLLAYILLI